MRQLAASMIMGGAALLKLSGIANTCPVSQTADRILREVIDTTEIESSKNCCTCGNAF